MTEETSVSVRRKKPSKIELAGEQVMSHLIELAKSTDLTYVAMAQKINEIYSLQLTKYDVHRFFKKNTNAVNELAQENASLSRLRAKLFLDYNASLVKDIKIFDGEIDRLMGDDGELLEIDRRAKVIGDLLDKKGRLLLRHARLSGELKDDRPKVENMQVNVFQQITEEKSDIIHRLKKAEFKNKTIDVEHETKKTNI